MAGKPKTIWSQEVIDYLNMEYTADIEAGVLYHNTDNGRYWSKGDQQNTHVDAHGYVGFNITLPSGRRMRLKMHQVILFFKNGQQPISLVDHKDRDKQNNAHWNLVETDDVGNGRNRHNNTKKGELRAFKHNKSGDWMLYIITDDCGPMKYLKRGFKSKQDALDYGLTRTMPTV